MYLRIMILFLLIFLFQSCSAVTYDNLKKTKSENVKMSSTQPDNAKDDMSKDDREDWEQGSYSTLLKNLIPIDSLVFVGEDTIQLEDLKSLDNLVGVSQETKNDFIEKNGTSKKIKNRFDVYAKIKFVGVGDSIATSLKAIKEKYLKSEGMILLSRVGLNNSASESLIYVEKYDLNGKVEKQFCFILRDEKEGINVKWFEVK